MSDLNKKSLNGLVFFIIALAALLFLPVWTFAYWQAWVFLGVFSISVLAITIYLMKNDPELLERRVNAGASAEKEISQKVIQSFAQIAFILVIIFPAIDHRFGWSVVPAYLSLLGDVLVAVGLLIVFFVFKENSYTSAIIEVDKKQKLIATGPYAVVRHPMYSGVLIMLLGVPIALGSWWGLLSILPITVVIIWRLLDEEKFLITHLPGYEAYKKSVTFRLIPFFW